MSAPTIPGPVALPPPPLHSQSTLSEILHALVLIGMTAASIFVKNPASQQHAVSIINTTNGLLPLIEELLSEKTQ